MAGPWTPDKTDAFRDGFYEFVRHFPVSSKERGQIMLGDHLYKAQTMFYETIFDGLREDCHDFYILKSRQLGISTGTRALSLFWVGMHEGLRGAMVFDSSFNTAAARREIEEALENLPKHLHFPKIKSKNRDALVLENDSWLLFMQAGTKNSRAGGGLGRSLGLNFVHASEISSWANEEGVISFRQSLSEGFDDRLFIWESTARGFEIWYRLWMEARSDPYSKRSLFIGWWAKDNQRIDKSDPKFSIYGLDVPNNREKERIKAVADQYECEITPEQLAWYRWKIDPSRELEDGDPEDSYLTAEQPWVEEEAFQQSGSSFFDAGKLSTISSQIATEAPKSKNFRFWPGLDFITCDCRPSANKREIELRIWEEPVQDSVYVVSGDPAFGHDEKNNNSAAQVLRCYADGVDQVAEFASAMIQPHQFSWLLWTLVGYYGMKPNSTAMMICELNGPGEEVWRQYQSTKQIVQTGYLRQGARERGIGDIFANARNYVYSRSDSISMANNNVMWKTSLQNKVQIMEACRNYLHNGQLLVRSLELIEEMKSITRDGDSIGAENANRDDRTFSIALAIRAWDERIRRGLIAGNRTKVAERAKLSLSIEEQYRLFQQNHLGDFFKKKEAVRMNDRIAFLRNNFRAGIGRRAPTRRPW